ncbi:MAG TPA: acyl-ACP thioesterase domain-containing protein [Acidimicrobiales bacterium]|nr:acyl-ACP thioesterase domain-containing protein [Acidimicrobiales bacterium]
MTSTGLALVAPGAGRRYRATRLVRLGDVLPSGEARLDALARYLQDVAADDGRDARIDNHMAWLVRKTLMQVRRRPRLEEPIELLTWASGSGARWAERRTTITVAGTPVVEAASLWVCVDLATMRPSRIPQKFWDMYGEAVGERTVSPRLTFPEPPSDPAPDRRPWTLRVADIDRLGHVNNAATWVAVEDEIDRCRPGATVVEAVLEYRLPIDRQQPVILESRLHDERLQVWLTSEGSVLAAAGVTFG